MASYRTVHNVGMTFAIILIALGSLLGGYIGSQTNNSQNLPPSTLIAFLMLSLGIMLIYMVKEEFTHLGNVLIGLILGAIAAFVALCIGAIILGVWSSHAGRLIIIGIVAVIIIYFIFAGVKRLAEG